jgi:hypothetical protein
MPKRTADHDPNASVARVVRQTLAAHDDKLPADAEAAWAAWIKGVQKIDERTRNLLRAAFELGVDAGRAASGGRRTPSPSSR